MPEFKVRALLANLLVHESRPVSTDRLTEDLWGDTPPTNRTGALHTKVWQLRRTLEDAEPGASELVVSRPPGYLLRPDPGSVDAYRFQKLVAEARKTGSPRARAAILADALALWRGSVLADFPDEDFARPTITRLEEQRLVALEERAEVMLELGEHSLLVGELSDLVAEHPLRERLRAAQMRALYRAGRQTEALNSFDELHKLLADRLGLEPGIGLIALRQAVLEQDPALTAIPDPITIGSRPLSNLPAPLDELIGRREAIAEVGAMLDAGRLVTLNGIGGVGKTRLALAVAGHAANAYPDGVWLAELAALDRNVDQHSGSLFGEVADLVATVLGVRDEVAAGGHLVGRPVPLTGRLADALRTKRLLLVLDNCEHLIEPVAKLSELLLKAVPGLRILATSQEPLGITGERLWTVPPLAFPDDRVRLDPASGEQPSAVRLFAARATAATPGFTLDESNVDAVHAICRRLDGIPLALELAATRVRALGVHEVAARLADRFNLLTMGERGAPARQQTLRAAIDWSWGLLNESEWTVLRRLAVHTGGCTLRSAEEVCAGEGVAAGQVMDLVARLVDRSLVAATDGAGDRRYRLLESVAAYCTERLYEAGESELLRRRHLRHYTEFAERARVRLCGPDQLRWLERLDDESANLRGALDFAIQQGAADLALRLVNASAWYWFLRGRLGEGSRSLSAALAIEGESTPANRAKALAWQAGFALRAGDHSLPPPESDEVLGPTDGADDALGRATALWFLGFTQIGYGEMGGNEERIGRALAAFRELGDRWGTAAALSARATQAVLHGDLATTQRCGEMSAALFEELGDGWGQLQAMDALAQLAEVKGDYDQAVRMHRDGLRIAEKLGLWGEVSTKLSGLGRIALLGGDYAQARELHERAMRSAAEQSFTFGEQFAEVGLGMGARRQGDLDRAESHLRRWLDWCRQSEGDNGVALILAELGFIAEQRGDAATARRLHLEGYAAARLTRDPRTIALSLEGLAGAEAVAGHHDRAALLLGAGAGARDTAGAPLPIAECGDVDRITTMARGALGARVFNRHFDRGRRMSPDEATRPLLDALSSAASQSIVEGAAGPR
ncbi:BTAD domain-containing putative transcriptional regulator [Micromonospora sp. NPDC049523]|uniref:BTAD domain-containing putative transcriptional regulator n=1 Tax=Micromonospora sp. NPDC049523 TaxID=3155921 RepID=UPI0034409ECC